VTSSWFYLIHTELRCTVNRTSDFVEYALVASSAIAPFPIILFCLILVVDVTSLISQQATSRVCLLLGREVAGIKAISIASFQGLVAEK